MARLSDRQRLATAMGAGAPGIAGPSGVPGSPSPRGFTPDTDVTQRDLPHGGETHVRGDTFVAQSAPEFTTYQEITVRAITIHNNTDATLTIWAVNQGARENTPEVTVGPNQKRIPEWFLPWGACCEASLSSNDTP